MPSAALFQIAEMDAASGESLMPSMCILNNLIIAFINFITALRENNLTTHL